MGFPLPAAPSPSMSLSMSMSPRWPSRTTLKRPRTEATKADLEPVVDEPATELVAPPAGSAAIATGVYPCRYAGAMMLYPYLHLVGAQAIFATCTGGPARQCRSRRWLAHRPGAGRGTASSHRRSDTGTPRSRSRLTPRAEPQVRSPVRPPRARGRPWSLQSLVASVSSGSATVDSCSCSGSCSGSVLLVAGSPSCTEAGPNRASRTLITEPEHEPEHEHESTVAE